jgi:hypothetical protein
VRRLAFRDQVVEQREALDEQRKAVLRAGLGVRRGEAAARIGQFARFGHRGSPLIEPEQSSGVTLGHDIDLRLGEARLLEPGEGSDS